MLRMHNNNDQTAGDQRRPSRISTISNEQQSKQLCSNAPTAAATTRLKSSSIAKVPLAKSRLRQPVESTTTTTTTTASKKPPVSSAGRPTSLPLGNTTTATRRSSLLPTSKTSSTLAAANRTSNKTTALVAASRRIVPSATTKLASDDCKRDGGGGSVKNLVAVVHPQNSQRVNSSATTNRLPTSTTHSTAVLTSTTPTPTTTTTSKTTNSANNKLMSSARAESGKVNSSNHKDVNGRESSNRAAAAGEGTGGGKQDGGSKLVARSQLKQILFGSQKTTPATANRDQVKNVSSTNIISASGGGGGQRKVSGRVVSAATRGKNGRSSSLERDDLDSSSSSSASANDDHDDRHYSLCNGNNNNDDNESCQQTKTAITLSVASKNFSSDDSRDKDARCLRQEQQQHGNGKQQAIKKRLPGHTLAGASPSARTGSQRRLLEDESGCPSRDNCYSNNQHRSAKSTLTKSTITTDGADDFNHPSISGHGHGNAFSHRLLSKPMGQQVLSLMMLDVGLLPSNSNNAQQQLNQVQQSNLHKVSSVSHVRIQSPPERDEGFGDSSSRVLNRCLYQNGQLFSQSDNIDSENLRFREQAANIPINEMLRLRLNNLNLDNQRTKSISLPSSPRLRVRQERTTPNTHHQAESRSSRICPGLTENRTSATRFLSPSRHQQAGEQNSFLQRPSFVDRRYVEDSRSISSSCSSLNHNYPPLLAISNQLNELNLQELMLQRQTATTQDESKHLLLSAAAVGCQTNSNNNSVAAIPTVVANRTSTKTTGHKSSCLGETGTITGNSSNEAEEDCDDGISNCFNACSLRSKPSDTDSGYENIGDHSPGLTTELAFASQAHHHRHHHDRSNQQTTDSPIGSYRDRESCPDPSLRQRQQQQRSHSISGQELNFNGAGYQRLNQFITQHVSPEVDHHRQRYGMQTTNIYQQSSQHQPQQQQHHLRTQLPARSPSPLSYAGHIDQNHDISSKYQNDIQKPRNQLHASLECLNSSYVDYQHHQQNQQQQQQQQQLQQQHQMRQHQMNLQNQHYAATNYVLASTPANTVVNQSGDQDLAAAAMDNGNLAAHQYQQAHLQQSATTPTQNNIYAHQGILNRAMAQVQQSPVRRFSSAQHGGTGLTSNLINNFTNLHHPIRAGHSSLSLSSSSYIIEDKLHNEIRKLHSELKSEKEKNEALNSQLNINSNLMAAFEQSLTTLNSRLRQLTTINEKKDQEIEELRMQLSLSKLHVDDSVNQRNTSPAHSDTQNLLSPDDAKTPSSMGEKNQNSDEQEDLMKVVEDLKRQLIEKDRLLTDTRLEALSAAHQLEQLESRLDREHRSIVVNEDDLDEGVMVVNHSPSDASDAVTDSAHFSEINTSQMGGRKSCEGDTPIAVRIPYECNSNTNNNNNTFKSSLDSSPECNNNNTSNASGTMALDNQSNHSSDYHDHSSSANENLRVANGQAQQTSNMSESDSQQFANYNSSNNNPVNDTSPMDRLMDSLLSSAS